MRLRTSRTLIASPSQSGILFYNFLTKSAAHCPFDVLHWTSFLHDWTLEEEVFKCHPELDRQTIERELLSLVSHSILLIEHSAAAMTEERYAANWEWGLIAGALHFSTLNMEFMPLEDSVEFQRMRGSTGTTPPPLVLHHGVSLPLPNNVSPQTAYLLALMARRRTNREAGQDALTRNQLADCLYAGLGIIGAVQTAVGVLPLSMTPSGGARNPFEAFVYAKNVDGLEPGFYHYSGLDKSLQLVGSSIPNDVSALLAGQSWAEPMPAIIFLVAFLERTMWKYQDPNAYRVVLIEAGHIGQNIMLAATAHGLTACPTAALRHDLISTCLAIDEITHAPVYALTLSHPALPDNGIVPLEELKQSLRHASYDVA